MPASSTCRWCSALARTRVFRATSAPAAPAYRRQLACSSLLVVALTFVLIVFRRLQRPAAAAWRPAAAASRPGVRRRVGRSTCLRVHRCRWSTRLRVHRRGRRRGSLRMPGGIRLATRKAGVVRRGCGGGHRGLHRGPVVVVRRATTAMSAHHAGCVESGRPWSCCNGGTAAVGSCGQRRIFGGFFNVLPLQRRRRHVRFVSRQTFLRSWSCGSTAGAAVVAHLVDGDIVDHRLVIGIVNIGHVHVVDGAIVGKSNCPPTGHRRSRRRHIRIRSLRRRRSRRAGPSSRRGRHRLHRQNPSNRVSTTPRLEAAAPRFQAPSNIHPRPRPSIRGSKGIRPPGRAAAHNQAAEGAPPTPVSRLRERVPNRRVVLAAGVRAAQRRRAAAAQQPRNRPTGPRSTVQAARPPAAGICVQVYSMWSWYRRLRVARSLLGFPLPIEHMTSHSGNGLRDEANVTPGNDAGRRHS